MVGRVGQSTVLGCDLLDAHEDRPPLYVIEWVRFGFVLPIFIKFGLYSPRVDPEYIGESRGGVIGPRGTLGLAPVSRVPALLVWAPAEGRCCQPKLITLPGRWGGAGLSLHSWTAGGDVVGLGTAGQSPLLVQQLQGWPEREAEGLWIPILGGDAALSPTGGIPMGMELQAHQPSPWTIPAPPARERGPGRGPACCWGRWHRDALC